MNHLREMTKICARQQGRINQLEIAMERLVKLYVANRGAGQTREFISCITPQHAASMTKKARRESTCWNAWDTARKLLGDKIK